MDAVEVYMQLMEKIMTEYEKALYNGDKTTKKYLKQLLTYLMCRTNKCFDAISNEELLRYVNELITSDICYLEYSGVDEAEDNSHINCMRVFKNVGVV